MTTADKLNAIGEAQAMLIAAGVEARAAEVELDQRRAEARRAEAARMRIAARMIINRVKSAPAWRETATAGATLRVCGA